MSTNTRLVIKHCNISCSNPCRYLLLSGGTVDITVHEIGENSKLKELHKSNGGHMGSTKVDENFIKILEELVGAY